MGDPVSEGSVVCIPKADLELELSKELSTGVVINNEQDPLARFSNLEGSDEGCRVFTNGMC
jgi:hypothetical protein